MRQGTKHPVPCHRIYRARPGGVRLKSVLDGQFQILPLWTSLFGIDVFEPLGKFTWNLQYICKDCLSSQDPYTCTGNTRRWLASPSGDDSGGRDYGFDKKSRGLRKRHTGGARSVPAAWIEAPAGLFCPSGLPAPGSRSSQRGRSRRTRGGRGRRRGLGPLSRFCRSQGRLCAFLLL